MAMHGPGRHLRHHFSRAVVPNVTFPSMESNPFHHTHIDSPAPPSSRQREYDPIVAAYQAIAAAYDQSPSWFDDLTVPRPAHMHSEQQFEMESPTMPEQDSEENDPLNTGIMTKGLMEWLVAHLPDSRQSIWAFVPPQSYPTPAQIDDVLAMTGSQEPPNLEVLANQPAPPESSAEESSPLEQIVMAETTEPAPQPPDYDAGLITPEMFQEAMQQAIASSPATVESPEEKQQDVQEMYDPQMEELLNPYRSMPQFNPFGMPGFGPAD